MIGDWWLVDGDWWLVPATVLNFWSAVAGQGFESEFGLPGVGTVAIFALGSGAEVQHHLRRH